MSKEETLIGSKGYDGITTTYTLTGISPPESPKEEEEVKKIKKKDKKKKKEKEKKKKKKSPPPPPPSTLWWTVSIPVVVVLFAWCGLYLFFFNTPSLPLSIPKTALPQGTNTTSYVLTTYESVPKYKRLLMEYAGKMKPLICLYHIQGPSPRVCLFRKQYIVINPNITKSMLPDIIETHEKSISCLSKVERTRKRRKEIQVSWRDEYGYILHSTFTGDDAIAFQMTDDEFKGNKHCFI